MLLVLGHTGGGITSAKVQQGRPVRDGNFLHLSDKDGVISGCVGLHDSTVQARQRAGNNRGTTFHLTVMNGEAAGGIGITLRVGEEFGERLLLFPEDADAEASAIAHVKVGFGKVINAHQHQRRAQRHRTKGTCRHAMYLACGSLDGNDRDARSEASKSGTEFLRRDRRFAHGSHTLRAAGNDADCTATPAHYT